MTGKLIVIESGSDASGKATQSRLLVQALKNQGVNVLGITFPDYDSPSSALVKMYLGGEFGEKADDVNAYAASVFFAVDRYASFMKKWKSHLDAGGVIVTDRYTTSNMVHQAPKLESDSERLEFVTWLEGLEYTKMGLPKPDLVLFLDVPVEVSAMLMENRANKIDGSSKHDIHESDKQYLEKCYKNSLWVCENRGWERISCVDERGALLSIEMIHEHIVSCVNKRIEL